MYLQKVISRKNCVKKLVFCWHLEVYDEIAGSGSMPLTNGSGSGSTPKYHGSATLN
jgi:hypothetical protein